MLHYLQRLMHKSQHFTEKEFDILSYFYNKRKGHVRQIKRALYLSEHTLLKYLSSLEKKNIISFNKEGNLKVYYINLESSLVKNIFSYFDINRLESLEYIRKKAINEFTKLIKKVKIPYFMLLFGSTSKGNYNKKSDIDLIIVYDGYRKEVNSINDIKKKILAETGINISFILMDLNDFIKEKDNKDNYALQDAMKTGYPVFGNQVYYEVVL